MIALQQPVSQTFELSWLFSELFSDLERMGDHAIHCKSSYSYEGGTAYSS